MELKKSPKADLENKRNIFLMVGLVCALFIILLAFEWTTKPAEVASLGTLEVVQAEEEYIPITREEQAKPPPPPPAPKVVDVINIVSDDVEIEEELEIEVSEADDETMIEVAPVIQAVEEEVEEEAEVFFIVEEMPEFPGGDLALQSYLVNQIKYPVIAQENGIQGKVYVTFVVDKDGSVSNAYVARAVDASLDKEALRVVNSLPKWKPGKQRGQPVRVSYTVPINFVLQ